MEFFHSAKSVRLRSHHNKFLTAEDDEESVCQDRSGSSRNARWTIEFADGGQQLRLKSRYDRYLTASNAPFLLGMTGRKVLQTAPRRLDSSVEWEPIREGFHIKLKTRYGYFLRANGGLPPWRNSITHDIPHRTATQDWILWEVEVMEVRMESPRPLSGKPQSSPVSIPSERVASLSENEPCDSPPCSPPKYEGRNIYFAVADDRGNVDDVSSEASFTFTGLSVPELTRKLKEETGLEDVIVCSRNPLNGNLYPLRLNLPPNNMDMHVIVVNSSSRVAKSFSAVDVAE